MIDRQFFLRKIKMRLLSVSLLHSQGCKFVWICYFALINYVSSVLLYKDLHGDFSPLYVINLFHTNVKF